MIQFYVRALCHSLHLPGLRFVFSTSPLRAESTSLYRISKIVLSGKLNPAFFGNEEMREVVPGSVNGFTLGLFNAFLFKQQQQQQKLNNCYRASGFLHCFSSQIATAEALSNLLLQSVLGKLRH